MHYYDLVFETCTVNESIERKLGFEKIIVANNGIRVVDLDNRNFDGEKRIIGIGKDSTRLASAIKSGIPAVSLAEPTIDKNLIETMRDNGCALFIRLSDIMSFYGMKRTRLIYKMGRLFEYSMRKVDIGFITLAKSNSMMCSYMQMIELAKMIGADEGYARKSISETNGKILVGE